MKKGVIPIILMIVVLILVFLCFLGPWYGFHIKYSEDNSSNNNYFNSSFYNSEETDTTADYHLTKVSMKGKAFGNPMSFSYDYSYLKDISEKMGTSKTSQFEKMMSIFDIVFYIVIACIIVSIIGLIFTLGILVPSKYFLTFKKLGVIFGIIVFILAIICSFYFMVEWNNLIQETESTELSMISSSQFPTDLGDTGFWYSYNKNNFEYSLGPGYAWYLIIITGVISLISSILLYLTREPVLSQFIQPRYTSVYPPIQ